MPNFFEQPARGFVSRTSASDWQHGLLTGNGTLGAVVPGHPHDETLYLSHAGLFLPSPNAPAPVEMASRLAEIRRLCLEGRYTEANDHIEVARNACDFTEERDRFIAAFALTVQQPTTEIVEYQRRVDFLTAEATVAVRDQTGASWTRTVFASRASHVLVLRLVGDRPVSAEFSFGTLPVHSKEDQAVLDMGVEGIEHGAKDSHLYYRARFATPNVENPLTGYEGLGRVVALGGCIETTPHSIIVRDVDEIVVFVTIGLLQRHEDADEKRAALKSDLGALSTDYATLLRQHRDLHGELMERVRFSLDVSNADRGKATEDLLEARADPAAALAQLERAFDAGRYNIICSTGWHPPNLQGLWSGTWMAPWYGSFTTNGNLPCAIAFLLMGNTPELMDAYFRYYDARWDGFRINAKAFFDMPGFHVPAQLTISPRATSFTKRHPHCFSHSGAAWALQFYYDYSQYTGDDEFLATRAYPLMKEAASFYAAFLNLKDNAGKVIFAPSYSPENAPGAESNCSTAINATMDVAACRQLLRNCVAAATRLDCDKEDRQRWRDLIKNLPDYEVDADGYFREWLWPGLAESHQHRHASHFYELYDEMPSEIVEQPELVAAVARSIRARLDHHKQQLVMGFGLVQLGLAAARIGRADLTQEAIQLLASRYWSTGMGSFHNGDDLFNTDISGGFPYLCASALVYADPGRIVFFPARPEGWLRGKICGLRLRGAVHLKELTWADGKAQATMVSEIDQTVTIEIPGQTANFITLEGGVARTIQLL